MTQAARLHLQTENEMALKTEMEEALTAMQKVEERIALMDTNGEKLDKNYWNQI